MKKLILSVATAACTALTVQAQDATPKPEGKVLHNPGEGAFAPEVRLKRLTDSLNLTQDQQDKIKKILEDGRADFTALKDVPQDQRREKFLGLMKAQHEKIMAVLTPEQVEKFKATVEGMRHEGGPPAGQFSPEEHLKRLTERLNLTQDQQDKIKKIFEDSRADFEAIKDLPQDQRREKLLGLVKAQHEKIMTVLTPEQVEKLKADLGENMRHEGHGGPQKKGSQESESK
jgi:Spy/CpxP family protein refolding chaperone